MLLQEETPDIQQEIANSTDEEPSIKPEDFVIDVSRVLLQDTLDITCDTELNFLVLNCIFFTG